MFSLNSYVIVKEPVIPLYLAPVVDTEINTQATYGTLVKTLETTQNGWIKIKTPDGEEGWSKTSYLTEHKNVTEEKNVRAIKNFFAHVYKINNTTLPPILTLPLGAPIHLVDPLDTAERWLPILLISGETGWIQRGDVDFFPEPKTLNHLIAFAKKFLGLPYTWGGVSTYGFDCSGLIQFLFKQLGVLLPRNARDQINSPLLMSVEKENLQACDLIFFGEEKINHVGLYLGDDIFLHAGVRDGAPLVMISSLKTTKYTYQAARRLITSVFGLLSRKENPKLRLI